MIIDIHDSSFNDFLNAVNSNEYLLSIFRNSEYWNNGGGDAFKLSLNCLPNSLNDEILAKLKLLVEDICPENCEAGCTISWSDMAYVLLNGDNLCLVHHNQKHKMDKD